MQSVCPAKLQICTATGQTPYLFSKGNQSFNGTVEYYQFKNVFSRLLKSVEVPSSS